MSAEHGVAWENRLNIICLCGKVCRAVVKRSPTPLMGTTSDDYVERPAASAFAAHLQQATAQRLAAHDERVRAQGWSDALDEVELLLDHIGWGDYVGDDGQLLYGATVAPDGGTGKIRGLRECVRALRTQDGERLVCTGCGETYPADQHEGKLHDHWTAEEDAR